MIYLNPQEAGIFKKDWADKNLSSSTREQVLSHDPGRDNLFGVICIRNGAFDALGLIEDEQERRYIVDALNDPEDRRPRWFYMTDLFSIVLSDPQAFNQLKAVHPNIT